MQADNTPRTLVIAAHPDDETIGAAVRISRTKGIQIIHVTDGSPLDPADAITAGFTRPRDYAAARREEAERALALAGVPKDAITNLGLVDQQVACQLEELTLRILRIFERLRPEVVLTHAYEGGHPDHDSIAFACQVAKKMSDADDPGRKVELVEFTGYHAEGGGIMPYEFLPSRQAIEHRYHLSAKQRDLKTTMLREFKSQEKTLAPFMLPETEAFRDAPRYDFRRPPHAGRLFYEYFDWGVDGVSWRELAQDAERSLFAPVERVA